VIQLVLNKKTPFLRRGFLTIILILFYPLRASAPPTISRISPVIAACLALL
jgi:hypothetical protein